MEEAPPAPSPSSSSSRLRFPPAAAAPASVFSATAGHHVTLVYFWVAMVTHCVTKAGADTKADADNFGTFWRRPTSTPLRNADLVYKHYSRKVMDGDAAAREFVPPDVKPLPSVVR